MAQTIGTPRSTYIRIEHPTEAGVFDVIKITQNESILVTTTTTQAIVSPPSGGPGGCHLAGTPILMADGTNKLIEELVAGDEVVSYGFNGLSQEENAWVSWTTNETDFIATESTSIVKSIGVNQFTAYRKVNTSVQEEHLKITLEHPLLVKSGDSIEYKSVKFLEEGDKLYYRDASGQMSWIDFLSVDLIETEAFTTYTIDVEDEDSYLAAGIIAHNVANIDESGSNVITVDDKTKVISDTL